MFYEGTFISQLKASFWDLEIMVRMQDILSSLLLPHFRSIAGLSISQLLYGFLQAAQNQVHRIIGLLCIETDSVQW